MKKRILLLAASAALLLAVGGILYGNLRITVSEYEIGSPDVPDAFDGFVLVQVSDLHGAVFGKENARLLNALSAAEPDCILVTGDVIDSRRGGREAANAFLQAAAQLAPVYYVNGNHESRVPEEYALLKAAMEESGVTVLEDESLLLARDGEAIQLIGLSDPAFTGLGPEWTAEVLDALASEKFFTVVLSHRPELFGSFCTTHADLVFAGHAHGGQFRIPGLGGLFAPDQGFFPAFSEGLHSCGGTAMVVSRGLGNSLFPFRVGNPPELTAVTLRST